jgi:CTP synthase (UTP-ammonia lyase)
MSPVIALVGDFSPSIVAHRAIPEALTLAARDTRAAVDWNWVATSEIHDATSLAKFSAIWLVPGSPYLNMNGALTAVRFARETRRPFLGTCGGFQHALIEIARNLAGMPTADHAESNPNGAELVVTRLACSLVEKTDVIRFLPGSLLENAYGTGTAVEGYRCNFGLSDRYRERLIAAGLRFTAFDANDDVRAAELPTDVHPFFVGTLFQPERAALQGITPPLARAFIAALARLNPARSCP